AALESAALRSACDRPRLQRRLRPNDVERYFSFVDEEIVVLTPSNPYRVDGRELDREEFERSLESGRTHIGWFQMLQPVVQMLGDAAVVTYFSRGSYGRGEQARVHHLKESDVLVRRAGGWKIVHIHVSEPARV